MKEMATGLENPAPALREVDKLERARNALLSEINRQETEYTAASMLNNISEAKIEKFLRGIAENMESLSREALKDFLANVIGRVILETRLLTNARSTTALASIWGIRWRPQGDSNLSPIWKHLRGCQFNELKQ